MFPLKKLSSVESADRQGVSVESTSAGLELMKRALDQERIAYELVCESETRLRLLAEKLPDFFWIWDPINQQLIYVSPAYEKIWGRTCESLRANPRSRYEAIHAEDRARVLAAAETKQLDGHYDETFRVILPDQGVRWIRERSTPIRDDAGTVVRIVGTAQDITEQRREEELARKSPKTPASGTAAARMAYDFNGIFATINGNIELARVHAKDGGKSAEYLKSATVATKRASAIVRQILAFNQKDDQMAREFLDVSTLVAEPLKLLRATTPAEIVFDLNLPEGLPLVLADPSQLRQVVMNLCTNALEAMRGQSGRMDVGLHAIHVDTELLVANRRLAGGCYLQLTVSDTGPGIDPRNTEQIFDPYFATHSPSESTGLGLAIVNVIVHRQGGAVSVNSRLGGGATFDVFLPALSVAKIASSVDNSRIKGRERILVVADEMGWGHPSMAMLAELGYGAQLLVSPQKALELIQAAPGAFDLVMSDLAKAAMGGCEFARAVRKIRADLPVLLVTDYFVGFERELASASGVCEILRQPFDVRKLSEAVHCALAGAGASR
jgi:two-component system cell cycle sensor histidine kinase/response regulator CckA